MDPSTISDISSGMGVLGAVLGGVSGFFSDQAKAKEDENNAITAGRQAGVNSQLALMLGNATAATAATRAAANGGGLVGSSMGIISNLGAQALFNARQAAYRGQTEQQNDLYAAKVARYDAVAGLVGAGVNVAKSVVGGFANAALESQQMGIAKTLRGLGGGMGYGGYAPGAGW